MLSSSSLSLKNFTEHFPLRNYHFEIRIYCIVYDLRIVAFIVKNTGDNVVAQFCRSPMKKMQLNDSAFLKICFILFYSYSIRVR